MSDPRYRALMSDVLAVNYWGEVLTLELLARALAAGPPDPWRAMMSRQLLDETRHANLTRRLLLDRGVEPRLGERGDFTFHGVFMDYGRRGLTEALACVGENERLSARHFGQLVRIAQEAGDGEVVSLYREILVDEITHSQNILAALPADVPAVTAAREDARGRMERAFSEPYLRLYALHPPPRRRR